MRLIRVLSFTNKGAELALHIMDKLAGSVFETKAYSERTEDFLRESFEMAVPVVIVGACGIAVRLVSPFVRDKLSDSAVIVCDETGRFVIPILSGHVGGANRLAREIADITGGEAVITTATDVNGLFAADCFAMYNGLYIENRDGVKDVSAVLLKRGYITMSIGDGIDFDEENAPSEIKLVSYPPVEEADVIVSERKEDRSRCRLLLIPRRYTVGMGCRRGVSKDIIDTRLKTGLGMAGVKSVNKEVSCIASIDLKAADHGLLKCAAENGLKLVTFSDKELLEVKGDFTESEFVREITGVSNVCERAAMCAAGEGAELVLKKQAGDGVTVAVARRKVRIERWKE